MRDAGQENSTGFNSRLSIDWSAILARHDRWLRTAIFARLRELDGVDEVMQAVALAAVEQRAPLLDLDKVAPWLYRLAIWQTLLYRCRAGRHRKLTKNYGSILLANDVSPGKTEPLAWLLSDERRRLVRSALERLSRRDAEVLLLKYSEDWTYRDLAAHLGISESSVEARLHRARGRLRRELANLNVTGE
jgi:RNA polymerase sigma factor (sigma-70 family)